MRTPAQIIRDYKKGKRGFTLVEVIIATTLFTTVSLISVMVFINIVRIQKRIYLENAIYEDGRFLMERISREIRQNAVDYEEYYNRATQGGAYGEKYGCYASRFYNPGIGGPYGTSKLGALCSSPAGVNVKLNPGCIVDKRTLDINTGQNPYTGFPNLAVPALTSDSANAFCDDVVAPVSTACPVPIDNSLNDRSELYLIDAKGKQKTIMALKTINLAAPAAVPPIPTAERALSMVRIQGVDADNDGIVETWVEPSNGTDDGVFYCAPGYDCDLPAPATLESTLNGTDPATRWKGFIPMSPLRSNIKSIHFYVSPIEDPRKAFAETDPAKAILQQPHVTVIMTLSPSASEAGTFGGNLPSITLQTTITSRVYNEVKSNTGTAACTDYPL